jgi:hypothetical protein
VKEEIKDLPKHFVPRLDDDRAKCTTVPQQTSDTSIAYKTECISDGYTTDMESSFRVESPKHFIATVKMDTKWLNKRIVAVTTIDGRHAGPCTGIQELVR